MAPLNIRRTRLGRRKNYNLVHGVSLTQIAIDAAKGKLGGTTEYIDITGIPDKGYETDKQVAAESEDA